MADVPVIDVADLKKTWADVEAVRGLTLQVPAGSIFGFLGRNGAGKTTTIKVLLGMVRPDAGRARVFDLAADAPQSSVDIRRRTGFVSEDKDLIDYMTVDEIIRFTASFYPRWRKDLEEKYKQQRIRKAEKQESKTASTIIKRQGKVTHTTHFVYFAHQFFSIWPGSSCR